MKNKTYDIFGTDTTYAFEGMVNCLSQMNVSAEQIAEKLDNLNEISRERIYITAFLGGHKELADKIEEANEILKLKRINAFKESIKNGTSEEFLAKMQWTEKSSLSVDIEMLEYKRPLTDEERICLKIIEESINNDIKQIALSQGFESVEAWREHNSRMRREREYNHSPRQLTFLRKTKRW